MNKYYFCISTLMALSIACYSQNASWVLSGNNDAGETSKLGTVNSAPLRLFTNAKERVRIDPSGNVGIGTLSPVNPLTIKLSGSNPASSWLGGGNVPAIMAFGEETATGLNLATAANAPGYRPVFNTRRSRGTLASPSAVSNNDFLASFVSSGYDGNAFQNPATIDFYVDGIPSAGNVPGRISFVTGTNAGNRSERLKVGSTGNFNFNGNQLTITQANGNVGIGTSNPDYKVNIFSSTLEVNNNTNLLKLSGRNPVLGFYDDSNVAYGYLKSWTNSPFAPFTKGMVVGSTPGYPIFLSTNYGATMTIANNNNVGVGTTTPEYKLEIKSYTVENNNNTNLLKVSGRNPLVAFYDENNNGYGYIKSWTNAPYAPFTNGMVIGSNPGYPIFLSTNYGVTMTIANNNNVGIGTTNPAYKLSVNGTIQAKELRVESGWADFVFDKSYTLKPLDEVAKFIQYNRHLPGIPAAADIQKNGLAVGEMQTKLMQKIEELTLYVIELQNQINELKSVKK